MRGLLVCLLFASRALATGSTTDVPYFLQAMTTDRDVAGVNENFRAMYAGIAALQTTVDGLGSGSASSSVVSVSSQAAGNNLGDNSSFTNTTFGVCRSTLTITTGGSNPVVAWINVIARGTSGNELIEWTVYQDGTSPFATTSAGGGTAFATGTDFPITGQFIFTSLPSAASHSYCLAMRVSAGTGTLNESKGFWGVYELH